MHLSVRKKVTRSFTGSWCFLGDLQQLAEPVGTSKVVRNTIDVNSEKAGVGGSTPSLATIFSIACRHFINFHINQLTAFLVVRRARSVQNPSGNDFVINEFRECVPCERSLWRAALEWP